MMDLNKEWSISFAGCGFMGIYYVGATSCILQRFPRFILEASKIYGASSGALTAAILVLQIPIEKCCADLMFMAKEARKHKLGPLHPAFNLLQMVKDTLQRLLPHDAHLRASGKLCVSLTRVHDGKNVLVSEFNSREELIQALICSCFIPLYCGVIPPTYRGVRYVDGAASNNLPRCYQRNTITFSPYAGESDLCPRLSTLSFHRVVFNNVSIQVNPENVYRVTSTFFPPEPQAMAEICQNGYMDALRFLQENKLRSIESPIRGPQTVTSQHTCCERVRKNTVECPHGTKGIQDDHRWLDVQLIDKLPVEIQRVLCEACRETYPVGGLFSNMAAFLPQKVTSYLQLSRNLPGDTSYSIAQSCSVLPFVLSKFIQKVCGRGLKSNETHKVQGRMHTGRVVNWIPDVPKDLGWLTGLLGGKNKQGMVEDSVRHAPLYRSRSLPNDLNLCKERNTGEESPQENASAIFLREQRMAVYRPLTPPPTPTVKSGFDECAGASPPSRGWGLGGAVRWLQSMTYN